MKEKQSKRKYVENWLDINKKILNIKAIEREIKVPENSIQRFTKDDIKISTRRISQIEKWMKRLLDYENEDLLKFSYKFFNISAIEREKDISKGVIQKHNKYGRKLNKETLSKIENWQIKLLEPIKIREQLKKDINKP